MFPRPGFVLLIAALLKPDSGMIRFDGVELTSLSEDRACEYQLRDLGFIYQRFRLQPRVSALENASRKLLLGGVGMREAKARAAPWLERVGLGSALGIRRSGSPAESASASRSPARSRPSPA